MRKEAELNKSDSCFNKAHIDELLFVLLARDPASPVAIRAWAEERLRLNKNKPEDPQISEAMECASRMETERFAHGSEEERLRNTCVALHQMLDELYTASAYPNSGLRGEEYHELRTRTIKLLTAGKLVLTSEARIVASAMPSAAIDPDPTPPWACPG